MDRRVCLTQELEQSRVYIPENEISQSTNQIPDISNSKGTQSQIPDPAKLKLQVIPAYTVLKLLDANSRAVNRIHGVMKLALAQRQRRDLIGPRSPLSPLRLTS